jgi:putative ABC transport system permease protein
MVLSENGARIVGKTDPIGKIVSLKHVWGTDNKEVDVMISGVYANYPSNSHFKPDYIINVNALRAIYPDNFSEFMEGSRLGRATGFFENYITLKPGADIKPINTELTKLANQIISSDSQTVAAGWKMVPFETRVSDLHFDKKNQWESNNRGDKTYLTIFSIIAILIMLIACINYMNLATARSVKRSRVG